MYLRGRGLAEETIRDARLGYVARPSPGLAPGISIPWLDGDGVVMIQVRRAEGTRPKYQAMTGGRRGGLYPGASTVRLGLPLIVVEGELDTLLLGQLMAGLAAVVTLGSASERPRPETLAALLPASAWYVATDADGAGDKAADCWPGRSRRVRPPEPFKDWGEARDAGVDLARWWGDLMAGDPCPPLFTWPELALQRWGPAVGDPTPGITIDRPGPE